LYHNLRHFQNCWLTTGIQSPFVHWEVKKLFRSRPIAMSKKLQQCDVWWHSRSEPEQKIRRWFISTDSIIALSRTLLIVHIQARRFANQALVPCSVSGLIPDSITKISQLQWLTSNPFQPL
jgi:hypothetical protein